MAVDVVVPACNEEDRLEAVLRAVVNAPSVGVVIVVSDGSVDATTSIASDYGVVVVPIDAHDKATAMVVGLSWVATDDVMFIDADLVGLLPEHVETLARIDPVGGQVVAVRGALPGGASAPEVFMLWPSISGERRLPADFARSVIRPGMGWRVETALNVAVARAELPHRQIMFQGVRNPRDLNPVKIAREWAEVAAEMALYAPELARYVWTLQ